MDKVLSYLAAHWDGIAALVALALHRWQHAPKVESNPGKAFGAGGGK